MKRGNSSPSIKCNHLYELMNAFEAERRARWTVGGESRVTSLQTGSPRMSTNREKTLISCSGRLAGQSLGAITCVLSLPLCTPKRATDDDRKGSDRKTPGEQSTNLQYSRCPLSSDLLQRNEVRNNAEGSVSAGCPRLNNVNDSKLLQRPSSINKADRCHQQTITNVTSNSLHTAHNANEGQGVELALRKQSKLLVSILTPNVAGSTAPKDNEKTTKKSCPRSAIMSLRESVAPQAIEYEKPKSRHGRVASRRGLEDSRRGQETGCGRVDAPAAVPSGGNTASVRTGAIECDDDRSRRAGTRADGSRQTAMTAAQRTAADSLLLEKAARYCKRVTRSYSWLFPPMVDAKLAEKATYNAIAERAATPAAVVKAGQVVVNTSLLY